MDHKPGLDDRFNEPAINNKMAHLEIADSINENAVFLETAATTPLTDEEVDAEKLASEMQERCRILLSELEQFQAHLKSQRKENTVELRTFKSGLQAEAKLIDKLVKRDTTSKETVHSLRSSNFQFYASVWSTAKACHSLTALSRKFYWHPTSSTANIKGHISQSGSRHRAFGAVADVVCQDGLEWVKVSSNTEKRIIWDLAKAGWVGDSDSEGDEDENDDGDDDDDDGEKEGLLRQVENLVKAARATRVRYRHPQVRLVLPRISKTPETKEVGTVLQKIRNMGVIVQTCEDIVEEPLIEEVLQNLVQDRFTSFSEVLNMDCTVLLAFVSDLSHGRVEPQDWHNKMIQRQRLMEAEEQLLPCSLWPACKGKKLVCTKEAAVRMQEIVSTIGTTTEKRRTDLLINLTGDTTQLTPAERLQEFQLLSDYTIPSTWQLPIEIVDVEITSLLKDLPPIASTIAGNLSDINTSVIMYGWFSQRTTISSNRAVAKEIENTIEENRQRGDEMVGPDVWLCSTTRSLVGKEKERRGGLVKDVEPRNGVLN